MTPESDEQRERRASDVESTRHNRAVVIRKADRFFRWETRVLYAGAIGMAIWVFTIAGQIQAERRHNMIEACQRESKRNAALVGFVADSIAANPKYRRLLLHPKDPLKSAPYSRNKELNDYIVRALRTFPTSSKEECIRRADKQVKAG